MNQWAWRKRKGGNYAHPHPIPAGDQGPKAFSLTLYKLPPKGGRTYTTPVREPGEGSVVTAGARMEIGDVTGRTVSS